MSKILVFFVEIFWVNAQIKYFIDETTFDSNDNKWNITTFNLINQYCNPELNTNYMRLSCNDNVPNITFANFEAALWETPLNTSGYNNISVELEMSSFATESNDLCGLWYTFIPNTLNTSNWNRLLVRSATDMLNSVTLFTNITERISDKEFVDLALAFVGNTGNEGCDIYSIKIYGYKISDTPTLTPSVSPSNTPTTNPSVTPTLSPTNYPTTDPTNDPSSTPTNDPTIVPTASPTNWPTESPVEGQTLDPTAMPTETPSYNPTSIPTSSPSEIPSQAPSMVPTQNPTAIEIESEWNVPGILGACDDLILDATDTQIINADKNSAIFAWVFNNGKLNGTKYIGSYIIIPSALLTDINYLYNISLIITMGIANASSILTVYKNDIITPRIKLQSNGIQDSMLSVTSQIIFDDSCVENRTEINYLYYWRLYDNMYSVNINGNDSISTEVTAFQVRLLYLFNQNIYRNVSNIYNIGRNLYCNNIEFIVFWQFHSNM